MFFVCFVVVFFRDTAHSSVRLTCKMCIFCFRFQLLIACTFAMCWCSLSLTPSGFSAEQRLLITWNLCELTHKHTSFTKLIVMHSLNKEYFVVKYNLHTNLACCFFRKRISNEYQVNIYKNSAVCTKTDENHIWFTINGNQQPDEYNGANKIASTKKWEQIKC